MEQARLLDHFNMLGLTRREIRMKLTARNPMKHTLKYLRGIPTIRSAYDTSWTMHSIHYKFRRLLPLSTSACHAKSGRP